MKTREYSVKNLHCSGCSAVIQGMILKLPGMIGVNIDIYEEKIMLQYEDTIEDSSLLEKINEIGNRIEPGTLFYKKEESVENNDEKKNFYMKICSFGGMIFFLLIALLFSNNHVQFFCYLISYFFISGDILWKASKNLGRGKILDENFLMSIASLGAIYLGEYHEAIGVMFFYKIGEILEEKAVLTSKKSISSLLKLRPEVAFQKQKDGSFQEVPSSSLHVGDIIQVKEGEKIPVDGKIIKGESFLDVSALTGEVIPMDVKVGDTVLSGSINGDRILELKVVRKFSDSTISKIIDMVEHANTKKSKVEKFMSKFARYYTPIVVSLALIVGLILPFFLGNFKIWFERAILFLVISCPCALVISIPLTFFHNIGRASKQGILVKGANYLEAVLDIKNIVFDKTGTLTKAKFQIKKIVGENKELLQELAKAGEFYSKHPIGMAIYESIPLAIEEKDIQNYKNIPGYGVCLEYKGKEVFLGKETYLLEQGISYPKIEKTGSIVFILLEGTYQGYIVVEDEIKEESTHTISQLQKLGFIPYILTGDGKEIGESVGKQLGINSKNIFTNLLPEQKVKTLKKIQESGKTLYIGDGINDAPVLASSDIGISMGNMGSDVAIEASDIVFMDDHIEKLLLLLALAKQNRRTLYTCITFALGIKILVMILGILGIANMWFAIFSDVGVTLLCILYSSFSFHRS